MSTYRDKVTNAQTSIKPMTLKISVGDMLRVKAQHFNETGNALDDPGLEQFLGVHVIVDASLPDGVGWLFRPIRFMENVPVSQEELVASREWAARPESDKQLAKIMKAIRGCPYFHEATPGGYYFVDPPIDKEPLSSVIRVAFDWEWLKKHPLEMP